MDSEKFNALFKLNFYKHKKDWQLSKPEAENGTSNVYLTDFEKKEDTFKFPDTDLKYEHEKYELGKVAKRLKHIQEIFNEIHDESGEAKGEKEHISKPAQSLEIKENSVAGDKAEITEMERDGTINHMLEEQVDANQKIKRGQFPTKPFTPQIIKIVNGRPYRV